MSTPEQLRELKIPNISEMKAASEQSRQAFREEMATMVSGEQVSSEQKLVAMEGEFLHLNVIDNTYAVDAYLDSFETRLTEGVTIEDLLNEDRIKWEAKRQELETMQPSDLAADNTWFEAKRQEALTQLQKLLSKNRITYVMYQNVSGKWPVHKTEVPE